MSQSDSIRTTVFISAEGDAKEINLAPDKLQRYFSESGTECSVRWSPIPAIEGQARVKDLALTILAVGASAAAILTALGGFLGPYLKVRALTVEREELEALRDKDGNPVLDNDGNPIFRVLTKKSIANGAALSSTSTTSVEARLADAFHVKIVSKS